MRLRLIFAGLIWFALLLLLAYSIESGQFPTGEQWAQLLAPVNLLPSAAVVLAVWLGIILRGVRWHQLMGEGLKVPTPIAILGFAWCFLLLQLLPFRSGEAARVIWVKLRDGSGTRAAASIVVERIVDAAFLIALVAALALITPTLQTIMDITTAAAVGSMAGLVFLTLPVFARKSARWIQTRPQLFSRLPAIAHALDELGSTAAHAQGVSVLLLTAAAWGIAALGFTAYLMSMHDLPWIAGAAVLAVLNLTSFVSVAPSNLGVFEAVGTLTLVALGAPASVALVTITGLHLAVFAGQLSLGLASQFFLLVAARD